MTKLAFKKASLAASRWLGLNAAGTAFGTGSASKGTISKEVSLSTVKAVIFGKKSMNFKRHAKGGDQDQWCCFSVSGYTRGKGAGGHDHRSYVCVCACVCVAT